MNLETLTTFASQFAGDPNQSRYGGSYTTAINESQLQFALDTRCLFKDQAFSVVADTATYTLPTDFMFEKKVTLATETSPVAGIKLEPISRATLEFYIGDRNWSVDTGTPKYFLIDPEEARKQIRLYPIPQGADAGTSNLLLTYYPKPTDLSAVGDIPLNSSLLLVQFHIAIAAYAAWLLLAEEPATMEVLAKRNELLKQYNDKVTQCLDR